MPVGPDSIVSHLFQQLSALEQATLAMQLIDGISDEQVAQHLNSSPKIIKQARDQARQKFRDLLGADPQFADLVPQPTAHHRTLAGATSGQHQETSVGGGTPLKQLQQAAFDTNLRCSRDDQIKANRELTLLADRIGQLPDQVRNSILQRICRCLQSAVKLLEGNPEAAIRWMRTPNTNLGQKEPLELVLEGDDGAYQVEQLIGRIQFGVLA